MPKNKTQKPQEPSRGHPPLKYNAELAEQFGITPGADQPRETVAVASLPDPPGVGLAHATETEQPIAVEEAVLNIIKDELDELGVRLARFGVVLSPPMKQEIADHAFTVISLADKILMVGGAVARR